MMKGMSAQEARTSGLGRVGRSSASGSLCVTSEQAKAALALYGFWPGTDAGNGTSWSPAELRGEIGRVIRSLGREELVALLWVAVALALRKV